MNTFDGPIVQAGDPERATIANSLGQDFPRVRKVVAVSPGDGSHVAEVLRLDLTQPERDGPFELGFPVLR